MAERKQIGLIFKNDKNWMGGTYYVLNLINALASLPSEQQPNIILLCPSQDDFNYAAAYTSYPRLSWHQFPKGIMRRQSARIINRISRKLIGRPLMSYARYSSKLDAIYPVINRFQISTPTPKLCWVPDFQERHLPQYFTSIDIATRAATTQAMIQAGLPLVFSSFDAKNDFHTFFPDGANTQTHVLHFATQLPPIRNEETNRKIIEKYSAPTEFFYCANQFWVHKNHRTLFEAVKILKQRGLDISIFCSGGTKDYRNPNYFDELQKFITDNNLESSIHILGFIDRSDQIALMQECAAIIQPSLFEGWSTSVEEAKAMGKFLILSDLPLHREQATENAIFFKRDSPEDLADTLQHFIKQKPKATPIDYNDHIRSVGSHFMNIINSISSVK